MAALPTHFLGRLLVVQLNEVGDDGQAQFQLQEPFGFDSQLYGVEVVAPAGFVTDFASVPRIPIAYEVDGNIAQDCATLHDFMYSTGCVKRIVADGILEEMMDERGFSILRRLSINAGVRIGGRGHFFVPPGSPAGWAN